MAELNPNIIMGLQQPQIQNPLDTATKALTLRDLSQRGQIQGLQAQQMQQEFNDNQAFRSAYSNNTSVDENGNPSINRQGILSDLAKNSPTMVPKAQSNFLQMDAQNLKANLEKVGSAAQMLNGVSDQASYDRVKSSPLAQSAGAQNWPSQYDPNFVQGMFNQSMDHKSLLETQAKQQGLDIEKTKADTENKKFNFEIDKYANDKQTEAFKDLMSHAESSRQLPDVKQAYTDRYNAQKVLDLVGSGDPNKLNPNMVQLVSGEVAKIAQGGVPQSEELKNITPQDAQMILARTKQYITAHPEASNQGAFVNVFKDYANTIQGGANKVIKDNIGKLGESYKEHLKPDDYQQFENLYVNGSPYSLKQTHEAVNNASQPDKQTSSQAKPDYSVASVKSMPVGTVLNGKTKTKNGWVDLNASK